MIVWVMDASREMAQLREDLQAIILRPHRHELHLRTNITIRLYSLSKICRRVSIHKQYPAELLAGLPRNRRQAISPKQLQPFSYPLFPIYRLSVLVLLPKSQVEACKQIVMRHF